MDGAWEDFDRLIGIIAWNSYAHSSMPEGNVRVGNTTYSISATDGWRAYADMNWGSEILDEKGNTTALQYAWGWFKVGLPAGSLPGVPEISLAAGCGLDHQVCAHCVFVCECACVCVCLCFCAFVLVCACVARGRYFFVTLFPGSTGWKH